MVRPGETLVVQVPMDTRPAVVNELQRAVDEICEWRDLGCGVLIVPGTRLGVIDAAEDATAPESALPHLSLSCCFAAPEGGRFPRGRREVVSAGPGAPL